MTDKKRLDVLVAERGLAESREQAQRLIQAGMVSVEGHPATKPGHTYPGDAGIVLKQGLRFVSRGGDKLEGALNAFGIDVTGLACLDVGASTGGFTDCLLQHGAARVTAVDVGKGQLHWKLRTDPRVTVIDDLNARHLKLEDLPEVPELAVIDVSFISLRKILPPVAGVLKPGAAILSLIKPQFEAGRAEVGKGGVVRDPKVREAVIAGIREFGTTVVRLEWVNVCESPVKGPAGNVEYVAWWRTPAGAAGVVQP